MVRHLVTGGAGFIGSQLVHERLPGKSDVEVVVLDRLTYAADAASLPTHDHRMNLVLDGGDVPLYGGDGRHVRDSLHVRDHCRALMLLVERGEPGRVYNVGGGTSLSNLIGMLLELTGAGPEQVDRARAVSYPEPVR